MGKTFLDFGQVADELGSLAAFPPHHVPPLLPVDDNVLVLVLDKLEDDIDERVLGRLWSEDRILSY